MYGELVTFDRALSNLEHRTSSRILFRPRFEEQDARDTWKSMDRTKKKKGGDDRRRRIEGWREEEKIVGIIRKT